MAQILQFKIKAQDQASPQLKKVETGVNKLEKQTVKLKGAFIAAAAAMAGLTVIAAKALKAFAEQELAVKRLSDALKIAGVDNKAYVGALENQAAALQKVTRFGDETILGLQSLLVTFGLLGDDLEVSTKAVLDLSAALNIDLKAAALLVGKAFAGDVASLSRYGIKIDEAIPKSEKFAAVLDFIQSKMGGRAAGEAGTVIGAFDQFKNVIGDFLEGVGASLLSWFEIASGGIGLLKTAFEEMAIFMAGTTEQVLRQQIKVWIALRDIMEGVSGFLPSKLGGDAASNVVAGLNTTINNLKGALKSTLADQKAATIQAEKHAQVLKDQKIAIDAQKAATDAAAEAAKELAAIDDKRLKLAEKTADAIGAQIQGGKVQAFGGVVSASASGIASGITAALGASGPIGEIAGLATELVLNAKELPGKINDMIKGLAQGIAEGIPDLILYFATDFIPTFINGLIQAAAGLIKAIPKIAGGLIKGAVTNALTILASPFKLFGSIFGGGPSPEEKLANVINSLQDAFQKLTDRLESVSEGIRFSLMSLDEQILATKNKMSGFAGEQQKLLEEFRKFGLRGKTKKAAEVAEDLADITAEQIQKETQLFQLENQRIDQLIADEEKLFNTRVQALEQERSAVEAMVQTLTGLKDAALKSLAAVKESIKGGALSPSENVERLQAAFNVASTPEAKSATASALAGGLQQQFAALRNMAAQGLISSEEFSIRQGEILAQIEAAERETIDTFQAMISVQERIIEGVDREIAVLEQGFNDFLASMEQEREILKESFLALLNKLEDIRKTLEGVEGFQGGGSVNRTGLAFLHSGETVLPKGSQAVTMNFNISGGNSDNIKSTFERQLIPALRQLFRNNTGDIKTFMRAQVIG